MEKLNPEEELLLNPSASDNNNSRTSTTTTTTTTTLPPQQQAPPVDGAPAGAAPPPKGQKAKAKAAFGGFVNWMSRVAEDVGKEVERGIGVVQESIEKEVHQRNSEGEREFWKLFNLPETERLLGVIGSRVLSGQDGLAGAAYLSIGYFCFNGSDLKIVIPLQTILKVQKALRVRGDKTVESIGPKYTFQPVPATARGDCIMLYTNDNMIHHFFSDPLTFGPMHNVVLTFETWYKMVDETWKARAFAGAAPASYSPHSAQEGGYPSPLPSQSSEHQQQPQAPHPLQAQQQYPSHPQQQPQPQQPQFIPYPGQGYVVYPPPQPQFYPQPVIGADGQQAQSQQQQPQPQQQQQPASQLYPQAYPQPVPESSQQPSQQPSQQQQSPSQQQQPAPQQQPPGDVGGEKQQAL